MTRLAVGRAPALAAPGPAWSSVARRGVVVLAASIFVALCAHVSVPLPFTPVPVVLSDFAVVLVGLLLGPAMASAALGVYLLEGAAGLPVFSPAGPGGIAHLLGPTAGYLFAYPVAAAIAGWVRRMAREALGGVAATAIAATLASAAILLSGAAWLAHWMHLSVTGAWALAVAPFLLGAAVKIATAVSVATSADSLRKV